MSLNFESENIFYVPEGEMLTFYDIFKWRKILFNIFKFKVKLNQLRKQIISNRIIDNLEIIKSENVEEYEEKKERMKYFLDNISYFDQDQITFADPQTLKNFVDISFWVRISDKPLESYFEADYLNEIVDDEDYFNLPVVGGIPLSSLNDFEMNFFDNEMDIILQIPKKDGVILKPLEVDGFLPIVEEFCGYFGTSNRGNLVNYDLFGTIARENLCCTPISKKERNLYQTLYFQIKTDCQFNLLKTVVSNKAVERLKVLKFKEIKREEKRIIFTRNDDVVHLYIELPGVEYSDYPVVPTFLIAVQYKGSVEPKDRDILMREILGK